MLWWLEFAGCCLLFAAGLRLSALFSGSEAGFYRLSLPRLSIDAQSGDRIAQRLLWYARQPAWFVGTTLIGNNIANYLLTLAISGGLWLVVDDVTEAMDVGVTLLLAPIIFLFGELLPKNLYFRAPLQLLRRNAGLFRVMFWLLSPLTWMLVRLTRLLEGLHPAGGRRTELMLGRSSLVQLISQGKHEGVLSDIQSILANGVLQLAPQTVRDSLIPADRMLGVPADASREDVLACARQYGTSYVAARRRGTSDEWYGYFCLVDVAVHTGPVSSHLRLMPVLSPACGKLEALMQLQTAGAPYGVIRHEGRTQGVVSQRGLIEQLFRPALPGRVGPFTAD
jgi:CBS domain containing-hemolysin-like protein